MFECFKNLQANKKTHSIKPVTDRVLSRFYLFFFIGKQVRVNSDMAIFITMNPTYAGRSPLPENLKQLFRGLAMTRPDYNLIAEVMLFSQGFRFAEQLSKKIVPLFNLCHEQLSSQSHYEFGLRALKPVLKSAGTVKRDRLQKIKEGKHTNRFPFS